MKLAEALIERADLQRRLAQLQAPLLQNAQYQKASVAHLCSVCASRTHAVSAFR